MRNAVWLLAAIAASAASAQALDQSEARDGDFGAKLLITNDPEDFWRQWMRPETPNLRTTDRITRGQVVETVIVFHDCVPAADGNCNVTVHFDMIRPDGKPYQKPLDGQAWVHPPAPNHNLMPSEGALGFKLDPPDLLGDYQIIATLTDRVSGKTLKLRETVRAVEGPPPPPAT